MFPREFFLCQISKPELLIYDNQQNRLNITVAIFDDYSTDFVQNAKRQYYENMSKSKQKTVWIEDEQVDVNGLIFNYIVAKHPMPQQDIYTSIALLNTQKKTIGILVTVNNEEQEKWLRLFKAMLNTITIEEENNERSD